MSDKWILDTGLVAVAIFLVLGFSGNPLYLYISLAFLVVLMIKPRILYPLAYVWGKLVLVLAAIVPKIVFSLVFYLLVFPIGFLKKLTSGDSLMVDSWKDEKSMFKNRNHAYAKADLENPY